MNTEEKIVETTENQQPEEKAEEKERTYTQEEYDRAVKNVGGKYLRKIDKYKAELEKSKNSEKIRNFIAESIGFSGTDEELLEALAEHYGKDKNKVLDDFKNGDISKTEVETLRFLNDSETSDDDIVEEYEKISDKPKSKQTAADRMKLELLSKKYYEIVAQKNVRSAEKWYKNNVGDDFEEFIGNENFREFIKDLEIPVDSAVKKYCLLKGMKKGEEPKKEKLSSGSARDITGSGSPEYFSPEDVAKMSRDEIKKNYDVIKKSQKHWYKKG